MLRPLAFASLITLSIVSSTTRGAPAPTPAPAAPPAPTCAPTGKPVIELDELDRTTAVFHDGSWTRDLHPNGKLATSPGAHQARCLAHDVIAKIEADLKAAPWTISHPIHCMIASSARTIVKVGGRVVFTERVCNAEALDEKSARLLLEIERLMDAAPGSAATPAPTATP